MARRSLRTRLTLLYVVPFFLSGAILVTIPVLQTSSTEPAGGQAPLPRPAAPTDTERLTPILVGAAIGLVVMVLVSVVLGWLIAGRFLRPLRSIIATARDISASNLHRRLGRTGRGDEFTELAQTLDDLFERLEAAFASQRRFVANASHELRTPLTAERTLLQVALADPDANTETLRAMCRDLLALGEAQERLIDSLLTLASSEQGIERREPLDLATITGNVVSTRRERARHRGIRVDAFLAKAPAAGDPQLVESLVANLVDNALRHNAQGGRVELVTAATAGRATLTVRNTGPVVPPGEVDRLFQPFQRLGGQRIGHADGHGLGLAIVRAIAGAHGATLGARARPEGGLDIDVTFPEPAARWPARHQG
ncbi:sensor histidine kinase [Phytohabitans rumicis]|uniref:histidine kinase n=1 Tax=Phytohabitans rumicis TaxID=1076125 RepID=A0A6V8KRQ4_9ACTN|nr:HAMP domain-containing sensor histidine kinase [Phytohabitans rumicis]GFJ86524.1 two-component sensor histidine kinase [Phytohabitans rumicis]